MDDRLLQRAEFLPVSCLCHHAGIACSQMPTEHPVLVSTIADRSEVRSVLSQNSTPSCGVWRLAETFFNCQCQRYDGYVLVRLDERNKHPLNISTVSLTSMVISSEGAGNRNSRYLHRQSGLRGRVAWGAVPCRRTFVRLATAPGSIHRRPGKTRTLLAGSPTASQETEGILRFHRGP